MIEHLDLSLSAVPPMKHADGIPMLMGVMSSQAPVHLVAALNLQLLSTAPNIANDPMFRDILIGTGYGPANHIKEFRAPPDVESAFIAILQELLESTEALGDYRSLTTCWRLINFASQTYHLLSLTMALTPLHSVRYAVTS